MVHATKVKARQPDGTGRHGLNGPTKARRYHRHHRHPHHHHHHHHHHPHHQKAAGKLPRHDQIINKTGKQQQRTGSYPPLPEPRRAMLLQTQAAHRQGFQRKSLVHKKARTSERTEDLQRAVRGKPDIVGLQVTADVDVPRRGFVVHVVERRRQILRRQKKKRKNAYIRTHNIHVHNAAEQQHRRQLQKKEAAC